MRALLFTVIRALLFTVIRALLFIVMRGFMPRTYPWRRHDGVRAP